MKFIFQLSPQFISLRTKAVISEFNSERMYVSIKVITNNSGTSFLIFTLQLQVRKVTTAVETMRAISQLLLVVLFFHEHHS